jgi:hypothetical protein
MGLMDAPAYDPALERRRHRRKVWAVVIVLAVIFIGTPLYFYWPYWQARKKVAQFMNALQRQNYQLAYYVWHGNPRRYPMDAFMRDWGPQSEWGPIKSFRIVVVTPPPGPAASGLVVLVQINHSPHEAKIWVENHSLDLSFYQY